MIRALLFVLMVFFGSATAAQAVTLLTTNSSDTLNTFRTNTNTNFTALNTFITGSGVIATSSALSAGAAVVYATGANTIASAATTTVTCGSGLSCTSFITIGASPITITSSAGGQNPFDAGSYSASTVVATTSAVWFKATTPYSVIASSTLSTNLYLPGLSAGSAYIGSGSQVQSVATTSLSAGTGISFSGTAGALLGGANLTINTPWTSTNNDLVNNNTRALGLGSSTPSTLWGLSIGTSTVMGNAQFNQLYASTTAGQTLYNVNWDSGNLQRFVLHANSNFVINATSSNPKDGGKYILKICQDPTGSRTGTFVTPGQLRWTSTGTTSLLSTANSATIIGMIYDARAAKYDVVASSTVPNSCN